MPVSVSAEKGAGIADVNEVSTEVRVTSSEPAELSGQELGVLRAIAKLEAGAQPSPTRRDLMSETAILSDQLDLLLANLYAKGFAQCVTRDQVWMVTQPGYHLLESQED